MEVEIRGKHLLTVYDLSGGLKALVDKLGWLGWCTLFAGHNRLSALIFGIQQDGGLLHEETRFWPRFLLLSICDAVIRRVVDFRP